jgi:hypothetical protein
MILLSTILFVSTAPQALAQESDQPGSTSVQGEGQQTNTNATLTITKGFIAGAIPSSPSSDDSITSDVENNGANESERERRNSIIRDLFEDREENENNGDASGDNDNGNSSTGQVTNADHILGGRWRFVAEDDEPQRFVLNMTMVKVDGSDYHTMLIENVPDTGSIAGVGNNATITSDEAESKSYTMLANITVLSGAGRNAANNGTDNNANNSSNGS